MHSKTLYKTKHLIYGIKQYLFATRLTTEVKTLTFLREHQQLLCCFSRHLPLPSKH